MRYLLSIIFILLTGVVTPLLSYAGVNLPWSTTYDCAEWDNYNNTLTCDGMSKNHSDTVSPEGYYEQITSAANNQNGDGGKGQRHWLGNNGDVSGNNSGGIAVSFNTPQTNIWMRWYMRFEIGFNDQWDSYKVIFLHNDSKDPGYIQLGYPGNSGARMFGGGTLDSSQTCSNCAWGTANLYPTGTSDGTWHCYEVNIDIAGGKAQWWIDGTRIINATGISWNGLDNVSSIEIGSNCKNTSHSHSMAVDYDDFAISNTGYIGPLSSSSSSGGSPLGGNSHFQNIGAGGSTINFN